LIAVQGMGQAELVPIRRNKAVVRRSGERAVPKSNHRVMAAAGRPPLLPASFYPMLSDVVQDAGTGTTPQANRDNLWEPTVPNANSLSTKPMRYWTVFS